MSQEFATQVSQAAGMSSQPADSNDMLCCKHENMKLTGEYKVGDENRETWVCKCGFIQNINTTYLAT